LPLRILSPALEETVQQASLARHSRRAVRHMYEAALAKRQRLVLHRGRMEYRLSTEYDLYYLLEYAERLDRVERNLSWLEEHIRLLQFELAKRRLEDSP